MYKIIDKIGDYEIIYEADTVEKVIELRNKSLKSEEVNTKVTSCWPKSSQVLHGKTFLASEDVGISGTIKSPDVPINQYNSDKGMAYIPFTVDKCEPNKIKLFTDEGSHNYKNQIRSW